MIFLSEFTANDILGHLSNTVFYSMCALVCSVLISEVCFPSDSIFVFMINFQANSSLSGDNFITLSLG